tara:strand:- start:2039 stop:2602 length:564 start_codon:yes stop_codon:yes gene_type:complete
MNKLLSPANLITIGGASLSLIGLTAYFTDATNLSVPTFFYGVPIFLIGISLKTTEVPPALRTVPADKFASEREKGPEELGKLVKDVTRWRYGQSCQLESSLRVLKLWDIDNPPQLTEVEELVQDGNYGIRMRFDMAGVPLARWKDRKERLGRFFAKGLCAELFCPTPGEIDLTLLPAKPEEDSQENE